LENKSTQVIANAFKLVTPLSYVARTLL